jgi:isopentenyldiphosphate isomerase
MKHEEEILDVVDENDKVLRSALRQEVYDKRLRHRIIHVMVTNSRGQFVLQKRSLQKSFLPGLFVTAGSGHIKTEETYAQAALRELQEEAGNAVSEKLAEQLKEEGEKLSFHGLYKAKERERMHKFIGLYEITFDGEMYGPAHEVDSYKAFSKQEVESIPDIANVFHPELIWLLQKHYNLNI